MQVDALTKHPEVVTAHKVHMDELHQCAAYLQENKIKCVFTSLKQMEPGLLSNIKGGKAGHSQSQHICVLASLTL